jgi:DNA-binding CsgD family transcriptional regulator
MLESRDLSDVISIGHAAFECREIDELRTEILNRVRKVFHAERGVFFRAYTYPLPRVEVHNLITQGIEEDALAAYQRYFFERDPFLKRSLLGSQAIGTGENLIPLEQLEQSDYYHEFLKPQSIYHQLVFFLRTERRLLGLLAIFRSKQEHEFSPYELAKAELAVPYISCAYERLTLEKRITETKEIINSICRDHAGKGIVALDESLEPIYMNEAANKALHSLREREDPSGDSLSALPDILQFRCRKMMEHSRNKKEAAKPQQIIIGNNSGGETISFDLRVIENFPNVLLCLVNTNHGNRTFLFSDSLREYGITRRETEIVGFVCQGLKNSEIGEKLFISKATVENHLHSIFEKMGVKNRASLVYRVTRPETQ